MARPTASRLVCRVATAGERLPRNITCSRSLISKSSSSSSETTRTATPCRRDVEELLAHEGGGADIEPPGGLRYEQELWAELDLAADDEFLQVAAGKAARRRLRAAAAHVVAGDDAARGGLQPVEADHAAPGKVGIAGGEQRVHGERERGDRAAPLPVLRHEGDAEPPSTARADRADRRVVQPDAPASSGESRVSPESSRISSDCPLPEMPAMPTISPGRTASDT